MANETEWTGRWRKISSQDYDEEFRKEVRRLCDENKQRMLVKQMKLIRVRKRKNMRESIEHEVAAITMEMHE